MVCDSAIPGFAPVPFCTGSALTFFFFCFRSATVLVFQAGFFLCRRSNLIISLPLSSFFSSITFHQLTPGTAICSDRDWSGTAPDTPPCALLCSLFTGGCQPPGLFLPIDFAAARVRFWGFLSAGGLVGRALIFPSGVSPLDIYESICSPAPPPLRPGIALPRTFPP